MIVSKLCIYPLKSGQGIELQQARVQTQGFIGDYPAGTLRDRELMLVSGNGKFITQRQFPQFAKIQVQITGESLTLQVVDHSLPPITFISDISQINNTLIEVEIWRDRFLAIDQGDEVAQWFHQFLNLPEDKICRLVRQSPNHSRFLVKKNSSDENQPLSLADNYPVMLTATDSLRELNQRINEIYQQRSQEISMNRFRPNIVIETDEPFIEDSWRLIQIGEIQFQVAKPCSRCIITTIDQVDGSKNSLKEPLNTLGTFRQLSEQGVMFGVNLIPQNEGAIRVGDRLAVLENR